MISENHKFIYVHIIKTGGTSLEKILKQRHPVMIKHPQKIRGKVFNGIPRVIPHSKPPVYDFSLVGRRSVDVSVIGAKAMWEYEREKKSHISAHQYKDFLTKENRLDIWNDYFKFSVVRNPFSYIVSVFKMLNGPYFGRGKKPQYENQIPSEFPEFVKHLTDERNPLFRKEDQHMWTQTDWLCDADGNVLVDKVGKMETLQKDFGEICKKLKWDNIKVPRINASKIKIPYTDYYTDELIELVGNYYCNDLINFNYKFGE
mgnify:FL=1